MPLGKDEDCNDYQVCPLDIQCTNFCKSGSVLNTLKAGFHMIADRNKVCDRLRSCDRDRRRSQKIEPCSV